MNGAFCLLCRERGPDLIVREPAPPIPGMRAHLTFRCGRCGARCEWIAQFIDGAWRYDPVPVGTGGPH